MGSIKLKIPHPQGEYLVGILEYNTEEFPRNCPIAYILHGVNAHKDQLYHKQLAKRLAEQGLVSFRFDFRANHESPGEWAQGKVHEDVEDLDVVVKYFEKEYGMWPKLLAGHSRGSITAIIYQCKIRSVPLFVNLSGRYRMEKFFETLYPLAKKYFDQGQKWERTYKVAGEKITRALTFDDMLDFSRIDLSFTAKLFPQHTNVLTIHGTRDEAVPIKDASIYAEIFSKRSPGTHDLYLVEGGNHNYAGKKEEVVEAIMNWYEMQQGIPANNRRRYLNIAKL